MKFVVFADLHLDAQFAAAGAEGQAARARRQALRDTFRRIAALAVEVHADALLCAGDLFEHERLTPDSAALLQTTFAELYPLPVYLAPGNHDWLGPASAYARTAWSDNVHLFSADRLQPIVLADGLTLWGAAHCAPANTAGFLDGFRVGRGGVNLALFHGAEQGGPLNLAAEHAPHAPFRAEQIAAAGLHHAFIGHYHRPRDARRHTYPGNPCPLTFGEDGERAAIIATVQPDGTIERERRVVAATTVADLTLDVTGCASAQAVRERVQAQTRDERGWVRVTLHGEIAPDVDLRLPDLADAAPWLAALVVRAGELRSSFDMDAIAAEPTVRGQFVRDVRAAPDLDEEQRRRVLLTGLRALAGRADLEAL